MASPTPNKGYTYPAHGGAVNAWDTPLNENFDAIDLNVGGTYDITILSTATTATYNSSYATLSSTVATAIITSSLAQNLYYSVSGALTQDLTVCFPAVGGIYAFNNVTTGSFSLTVNTVAGGSVGATIAQGGTNVVVADGDDVMLANTNTVAKLDTYLGDPNTHVAGTAAATNGGTTDVVWDATNEQLYVCTTSGVAADAVWTPQIPRIVPEGYLTISATASSPIITSNTTITTGQTIKYVPFVGNWTLLSNGTVLYPYQFSTMLLYSTTSLAASQIYDIFIYENATAGIISPVIGFGPAWTVTTPGSCSRGTGAGTTEITRFNGIWTNANTMNLTHNATGAGNTTVSVPVNKAVYLGSVYIDSTAGSLSCFTGWGQSRKWAVWNAYNRNNIYLKGGDSTASWTYNSATYRASNGDANNNVTVFCGLAEEVIDSSFIQRIIGSTTAGGGSGIGWNVTNAVSGMLNCGLGTSGNFRYTPGRYLAPPSLGINLLTAIENDLNPSNGTTFYGTEAGMLLSAQWRG